MSQAILGDVVFSFNSVTFQDIGRVSSFRFAIVERLKRRPAVQGVGKGLETIEISGVYYPQYRGGMGLISPLRNLLDQGDPVNFTCSWQRVNENLGRWVLETLDEKRMIQYKNAIPGKIEFSASLKQYGEEVEPQ